MHLRMYNKWLFIWSVLDRKCRLLWRWLTMTELEPLTQLVRSCSAATQPEQNSGTGATCSPIRAGRLRSGTCCKRFRRNEMLSSDDIIHRAVITLNIDLSLRSHLNSKQPFQVSPSAMFPWSSWSSLVFCEIILVLILRSCVPPSVSS